MKNCYLLLTHSDYKHFGNLICSLGKESDIYVHVDLKTNIKQYISAVEGMKNVFFVEKRQSVSWAGISMIDAQNSLILEAYKSENKYNRFTFLSGSCYPIKPEKKIIDFFCENNNINFIKYFNMLEADDCYREQILRKWFKEPLTVKNGFFDKAFRRGLNFLRIKNLWPDNLTPYFGSQWISLTRDAVGYIIDFQKSNPWYRDLNKRTFSPDEHYFHTIIGNSELKEYASGLQPFEGRGTWRMANLHLIDPSLAKWFTEKDFSEICESEKFFVRKIRSVDGEKLVKMINQKIILNF